MSGPEFTSTLRSTGNDLTAALRFLEEYAKQFQSHTSYSSDHTSHRFVPRFDLEEHKGSYELYGELPGFDKDHITVEANDDRNIQITGWIPRKYGGNTLVLAGTVADPFVIVQHHDVPAAQHNPTLERFGEALNPHRDTTASDAPPAASSHSHDPTSSSASASAAATTTTAADQHPPPQPKPQKEPHGSETARFGDVLDPHAAFVHRPKDSAGATGKPPFKYLMAERQYGQFHRAFHFPTPIRREEVQARLENGVLHISAPRAAVPPPTRVEIKKAPTAAAA